MLTTASIFSATFCISHSTNKVVDQCYTIVGAWKGFCNWKTYIGIYYFECDFTIQIRHPIFMKQTTISVIVKNGGELTVLNFSWKIQNRCPVNA